MFAGAEAVRRKIHAVTRELPTGHIADFHRVGHAAGVFDAETRVHGFACVEVADDEAFGARALPPAVDLVRIGRAPIMRGRQGDIAVGVLGFRGHGMGRDFIKWNQHDKRTNTAAGVELLSAGLDEVPGVHKNIHAVMPVQTDLVEVLGQFDPKLVKMCPAGDRTKD